MIAKPSPVPDSGPLHDFIATCLATSGFCVLHRPYIEEVAAHALVGAADSFDPVSWPGATRWLVTIERGAGREHILVLARSDRDLAQRVEWILGAKVVEHERASPPGERERINAALQARSEERRQEKLRRLREKAAEDVPEEDGPRRREILSARAELAALGG